MKSDTYKIKKDIDFLQVITGDSLEDIAKKASLSRRTIQYAFINEPTNNVLEKLYTYIYKCSYRLSKAKCEIFGEILKGKEMLFFHGSKYGFEKILYEGSRSDSDFSNGFYCSVNLDSAISFVEDVKHSSVYVYKADISNLKVYELDCDLDWMLAISYYRNKISEYADHRIIKRIINKIESSDIIIAPIADNKMFEILNQFAIGEITTDQAIHSLSVSRLGKQYVFKTKKAVSSLKFIDRFYLCDLEREASKSFSIDNANIIQTKLDLAKRKYRGKGQYIDELFI